MISVIIPAHNEKERLAILLKRFPGLMENQPVEIIIALSSGNSDSTEQLAFGENIRLLKCKKKSRAAQMNHGAEVAQGSILAFLHADVIPPKTFFSDICMTLSKDFSAGFFSYQFDKDNFLLNINAFFTAWDSIFTGGGDQCLFIKKETFVELGGFDESQVLMEDFEIFRRMKKNKISYKIIKNNLTVSARKYDHNSYLRVNLTNLLLIVLFKLGCSPQRLKSLHQRLLK